MPEICLSELNIFGPWQRGVQILTAGGLESRIIAQKVSQWRNDEN